MHSSSDFLSTPNLDYEAWRDAVRSICGRYTPGGIEPKTFSGRARVRSIWGFGAVELSSNAHRLERTHQDVRADARDHYYAIFQMTGQSRIIQNDRTVELTVGDVALVDAARSVTYVSEKGSDQWWGSLQLPRRSLVSHLGLEPRCLSRRSGAAAARPLRQLLQDGVEDQQSMSVSANAYMRLAFYDLLGALFAPSDPEDRYLSSYRQAVRAHLRYHQGSLCRSGLRSLRGGGRGGNFVTLPSEALHGQKLDLQSFHTFGSSGSRRASARTSVVSENKPAHQRDRLRQRLWRLY
jgi:hypothetical protein